MPLPEPMEADVYRLTDEELEASGISRLPRTLDEAIRLGEESELLEKALGSTVKANLLENKRLEWQQFCNTVTDYEKERYRQL
jgi:glutamine synthetase